MTQLPAVPAPKPVGLVQSEMLVPALIADAGDHAARRFLEFFAATIRNNNTRLAYYRAATRFFAWCDQHRLGELADIEPLHIAAYVEAMTRDFEKPSVKQHLAGIPSCRNNNTCTIAARAVSGLSPVVETTLLVKASMVLLPPLSGSFCDGWPGSSPALRRVRPLGNRHYGFVGLRSYALNVSDIHLTWRGLSAEAYELLSRQNVHKGSFRRPLHVRTLLAFT